MSKAFDGASQVDGDTVEIYFSDGHRYDMPIDEWRAIVEAAHEGFLTWKAIGDDE